MREARIQLLVGKLDLDNWLIMHEEGSPSWMEGANGAGNTRVERMLSLKESFLNHGISVQHDEVEGVSHDFNALLDKAKDFFPKY